MVTKTLTVNVTPAGTLTKSLTVNVAPSGATVGPRKTLTVTVGAAGANPPIQKTLTVTVRPGGATVVAGPNRLMEAGQEATLVPQTEQASAPIISREWRQDGLLVSTTGSLNFVAPITAFGTSVTLTYKVTDSAGNSVSSSLVVVVMPAPIRGAGGVPMIEKAY